MRHTARRLMAAAALAGLALLGLWADAGAAPFVRPRPTPRPTYNRIHELPRIPDIVRTIPIETVKKAPVESPAAEVRPHWDKVTQALGAETTRAEEAYVVLRTGSDGNAWMATNLVRGASSDRTFTALSAADLKDEARLGVALQRMLGTPSASFAITLKVLLEGSLADDAMRAYSDEALAMATDRFQFAELIEISSGRAYALERVARESGSPLWLSRLNQCCVYTGIPPDIANWQHLASVPFARDRLQVVSLFPDLEAQSRLNSSGLQVAISHPDQLTGDIAAALMQVFASGPPGSPVAVIGHVNSGSFVIEMANGGTISLAAISEMARQTSRPVYLLGCYTAEHYGQQRAPSLGFPVTTRSVLYPREVIDRLGAAGRNAKTLQDFTALISSESLYVQLPTDFLTTFPDQRRSLFARIASVTQNGARAITGFFRADLPCPSGSCP